MWQNAVSDQVLHCLPVIQQCSLSAANSTLEVCSYCINPKYWKRANSVDPDWMLQYVVSDRSIRFATYSSSLFKF